MADPLGCLQPCSRPRETILGSHKRFSSTAHTSCFTVLFLLKPPSSSPRCTHPRPPTFSFTALWQRLAQGSPRARLEEDQTTASPCPGPASPRMSLPTDVAAGRPAVSERQWVVSSHCVPFTQARSPLRAVPPGAEKRVLWASKSLLSN